MVMSCMRKALRSVGKVLEKEVGQVDGMSSKKGGWSHSHGAVNLESTGPGSPPSLSLVPGQDHYIFRNSLSWC